LQPCAEIQPLRLLQRGKVRVDGFSAVAGLPDQIARRQARRAMVRLKQHDLETDVQEETWEGGPGTGLARILGATPVPTLFFGLGERGKPAERVADEAVDQVFTYLGAGEEAAVDSHSADQIVLPLALSKGASEYTVAEVTLHLLTNVAIIREFLDRDIVWE